MPKRYQHVYPEAPLLKSGDLASPRALDLLTLEFFEAAPGEMPHEVFEQHHILINLRDTATRVENWRDDVHRDFTYHKNEIIVTPAGVKSGWRWHETSKVIVITIDPPKLELFAQNQLGILLDDTQLKSIPQFVDQDITEAAVMLKDALENKLAPAVLFESYARIFLVKLLEKYRVERTQISPAFTAKHFKRVLDYVAKHYGSGGGNSGGGGSRDISMHALAKEAGLSTAHFSRQFKQTIGTTPHQFVMAYRVDQAKRMLCDHPPRPTIDIALACGFSDHAHFSRVFKQFTAMTPKQYRTQHARHG